MLLSNESIDGVPIKMLTRCSEKRVALMCDGKNCKKIYTKRFAAYIISVHRKENKDYCRPCAQKIEGLKKRGKPSKLKGRKFPERMGVKNSRFKNEKTINDRGYIYLPNPNGGKREPEHRFVVEQSINRKLNENEIVHHIDGNTQNNNLENLFLTDMSGHKLAHYSLKDIGFMLIKQGIIGFDSIKGRYFLK